MDKAVLVTGAAKRIGRAIALCLARAGWFVWVHYNTSHAEAGETLAAIRETGGGGDLVQSDLADPEAPDLILERAGSHGPPLVGLVLSASHFAYDTPSTATAEALDRHYAVNQRAQALLLRAFASRLSDRQRGAVVAVLDNRLFAPNPDYFSYSLTKYALMGMVRMSALDFAPRIRVCGVAPGIVLPSGQQSGDDFERVKAINPLQTDVRPEDVGDAVRFLLENEKMTGEILVLDAGQSLWRLPRDVAFLDPAPGTDQKSPR